MHDEMFKNDLSAKVVAGQNVIQILSTKQPITDVILCDYLKNRGVEINLANKYCHEVFYALDDKIYSAIGFKNNAGGYELRNEYFKGSSFPKYVTYINNNAGNITVFESFFDFLSYQSIYPNREQPLSNFLVLNSLSFFERSLLLMEKHTSIRLYLDNDDAGRKWTSVALRRSSKFNDSSKLYKGYKDLNEWIINISKTESKKQSFRRSL